MNRQNMLECDSFRKAPLLWPRANLTVPNEEAKVNTNEKKITGSAYATKDPERERGMRAKKKAGKILPGKIILPTRGYSKGIY